MKFYSAEDIGRLLNFEPLINALQEGFTKEIIVPPRMHLNYDNPQDKNQNTLLLMPAVQVGNLAGVKIVNVSPENQKRAIPTIQGVYYLMDAISGSPIAMMDAKALTNWRTAAASALASRFLSNENAETLLMVGTGTLAPFLIRAHSHIRPIKHLLIYGRSIEKAEKIAERVKGKFETVAVVTSLEKDVPKADIISTATLSKKPLILGKWLREGQHLDLIGSFKPTMREADNKAITKANVYADCIEMASKESGDLCIPIQEGVLKKTDIKGDLFSISKEEVEGRTKNNEVTLFKSVGHALEDLVAAELILKLDVNSNK